MFKQTAIKTILACAMMIGMSQASPVVTPTLTATYNGDLSWQDIKSVTYTWQDNNNNNAIDVGEKVTFSIDVNKQNMGTHLFDALKVWINDSTVVQGSWYLDGNQTSGMTSTESMNYGYHYATDTVFTFSYTFNKAGNYALSTSVTCSRDLAALYTTNESNTTTGWRGHLLSNGTWNAKWKNTTIDNVTKNDWKAWGKDIHSKSSKQYKAGRQGQDKDYLITVVQNNNVPEPGSFLLILLGLASLAGALVIRKKRK